MNEKQVEAENATIDLITGQAQDIHQVMLATEEARLTLELAVQIRNKLVDAYQEIMRIQI
ncbi:flagellar hook-basal body complex protein FliE [Caloramator sp. Dgby_cultured_2]|uniref:flagellar hook-basal body complex protein FliE n=1 Tax=Caloramator sp. Dgby_cultured_2 TaxID=3029174 RepID=UPI00237EC5F9|nr:flagellar hook-basal body complex protein FliE [Caloramator sp. Dgby_cultured_2]WDU83970.1 flagellar hook-basal body complex protein FliE [Caloramator sp. Dgby_cultured_2]